MGALNEWIQMILLGTRTTQYCLWHFIATSLFMLHLEKRKHAVVRLTAGVAVVVLYFLLSGPIFSVSNGQYEQLNVLWFISVFFLSAAVAAWICRISWKEAFYCAINGTLTEHLASSVFIYFSIQGGGWGWSSVQYYLVYIVVYSIIYRGVARGLSDDRHYAVNSLTVVGVSAIGVSIAILLSMQIKVKADTTSEFIIADEVLNRVFQLCQIYAICFCVLMLLLQVFHHRDLIAQKKIAVNKALWEQRQAQYQRSKNNIDLINRKCHDMKHQIAALMQMEGNTTIRDRLAKEIQDMIEIYDSDLDTGNEVLNTILTQRSFYCKMHEIQWTCMADGSILSFIDSIDIFTLLGNALDNAVESVEKISNPKRRIIHLQIGKKDSFAVIQLENSFDGELTIKNGFPVTTKGDKQNHGFGLRSICALAEKYLGSASFNVEDQVFILKILIPLPENASKSNFAAKTTD